MEKILKIPSTQSADYKQCLDDIVNKAKQSLLCGNVIAVPTDTIYGVAALAQSTQAVNKMYDIKQRHKEKAVSICVGAIQDVKRWGKVCVSDELLNDLLPGPVTLIFERVETLNPELNPTHNSIGIRIPLCPFIQELALACKEPLALTSANISSARSTLKIKEFEDIWDKLDIIVDGGTLSNSPQSRSGSTIVDLSKPGEFSIVRDGCAYDTVLSILEGKYQLRNTTLK